LQKHLKLFPEITRSKVVGIKVTLQVDINWKRLNNECPCKTIYNKRAQQLLQNVKLPPGGGSFFLSHAASREYAG
jgi:hypothetical protein